MIIMLPPITPPHLPIHLSSPPHPPLTSPSTPPHLPIHPSSPPHPPPSPPHPPLLTSPSTSPHLPIHPSSPPHPPLLTSPPTPPHPPLLTSPSTPPHLPTHPSSPPHPPLLTSPSTPPHLPIHLSSPPHPPLLTSPPTPPHLPIHSSSLLPMSPKLHYLLQEYSPGFPGTAASSSIAPFCCVQLFKDIKSSTSLQSMCALTSPFQPHPAAFPSSGLQTSTSLIWAHSSIPALTWTGMDIHV